MDFPISGAVDGLYFFHKTCRSIADRYSFLVDRIRAHGCPPISLILYFCSCFWASESSLLRRLFQPLHLCVFLLLHLLLEVLKRKVFISSFFMCAFPLDLEWKMWRTFKAKKTRIFMKLECFSKDTLKFVKRQLT